MIHIEIYDLIFQTDLIKDICQELNIKINLIDIDIIIDEDKYGMMDEVYRMDIINKYSSFIIYKINILSFQFIYMDIEDFIQYVYNLFTQVKEDYTNTIGG